MQKHTLYTNAWRAHLPRRRSICEQRERCIAQLTFRVREHDPAPDCCEGNLLHLIPSQGLLDLISRRVHCRWHSGQSFVTQLNPDNSPSSSISIPMKAGTEGRPGMVMMSPHRA